MPGEGGCVSLLRTHLPPVPRSGVPLRWEREGWLAQHSEEDAFLLSGANGNVPNLPWRSCPLREIPSPLQSPARSTHTARDRVACNAPKQRKAPPMQRKGLA